MSTHVEPANENASAAVERAARRVLVADDDLTTRRLLEANLRAWGYEAVIASNGRDAWAVLEESGAPLLAILDWMMPGIEGPALCRRMRALERATPPYLILLTALLDKSHVVEGLEAGADDYLTKPFDKDVLLARLHVAERTLALRSALAEKVGELTQALSHVKRLQGILPLCMHCHRIRSDEQAWQQIDLYLRDHADVEFSHGLCPDCLQRHYPDTTVARRMRGAE